MAKAGQENHGDTTGNYGLTDGWSTFQAVRAYLHLTSPDDLFESEHLTSADIADFQQVIVHLLPKDKSHLLPEK